VRVTAITGDTLLKLVGGQVRHELSEYSLADVHPSLSAIATVSAPTVLGRVSPEKVQIEKSKLVATVLTPKALLPRRNY
jgi:hypothetical protein